MDKIDFPKRIFFTAAPGSKWSGIAQALETINGFNISDRNKHRQYFHHQRAGHIGAYFGNKMEFDAKLDATYIDTAWSSDIGCKLVKSHEWANQLDNIIAYFPSDWILLVYRPDLECYSWWHQAGGFEIKYPNYSAYLNTHDVLFNISKINSCLLEFAYKYNLTWNYFTSKWVKDNFGTEIELREYKDVLVTLYK